MNLAVIGSGYLAQTFRSWALLAGHDLTDISHADLVWLAEDTPVDERGEADVKAITDLCKATYLPLHGGGTFLVSSQVPVGTTRKIAMNKQYSNPKWSFAYHPENIRVGHGVEDMLNATRIVVGCDSVEAREACVELFDPIQAPIHWMSVEAAEMVKSALNAYLALNIAFANEIGRLCDDFNIPYELVERALRTDPRVGAKAYLRAGEPFAMAHLGRDLRYLEGMGSAETPLIRAIRTSNDLQRGAK